MVSLPEGSNKIGKSQFRPIAVIFFYKLPVVVVVESGVALDGLLLTQVLVLLFNAVNSSAADLSVIFEDVRSGGEVWNDLLTVRAPRGIEHDQGVFLLLQGLPEVVPRQMQHAGLLLFPGGLWGWGGLRAAGSRGGGDTVIRRGSCTGKCFQPFPSPPTMQGSMRETPLLPF